MATPAQATARTTKLPEVAHLVRLLLGAVGVVGTLSAIGFIHTLSKDDFLGVSAGAPDLKTLVLAAGAFIAQTILVILDTCSRHYGWSVSLVALVWPLRWSIRKYPARWTGIRLASFWILLLALTADFVLVCLPATKLSGVMVEDLAVLPLINGSSALQPLVDQFWQWIIDSRRLDAFPDPLGKTLRTRKPVDHRVAGDRLEATYTANILLCLAGWLVLVRRTPREDNAMFTPESAFAVVLGLVTLFSPYVFGKLAPPTSMPAVSLEVSVPGERESTKEAGLLIAQDEKSYFVLEFISNQSLVMEIPRNDVRRVYISGYADALAQRIERWRDVLPPR